MHDGGADHQRYTHRAAHHGCDGLRLEMLLPLFEGHQHGVVRLGGYRDDYQRCHWEQELVPFGGSYDGCRQHEQCQDDERAGVLELAETVRDVRCDARFAGTVRLGDELGRRRRQGVVAAGDQPAAQPHREGVTTEVGRPQRARDPDADDESERILDIGRDRDDGDAAENGETLIHAGDTTRRRGAPADLRQGSRKYT